MKFKCFLIACALTACTGETEYGECVGFGKDRDPALKYEVSTRNVVWTVIGSETAVVPIVWALEYVYCPMGRKAVTQ